MHILCMFHTRWLKFVCLPSLDKVGISHLKDRVELFTILKFGLFSRMISALSCFCNAWWYIIEVMMPSRPLSFFEIYHLLFFVNRLIIDSIVALI